MHTPPRVCPKPVTTQHTARFLPSPIGPSAVHCVPCRDVNLALQFPSPETPVPHLLPFWYNHGMDLNIKGLDDNVGKRLRDQAAAAGVSMQQYLRSELTRIASRLSPAEFARGHKPMTRDEFLSVRQRLRQIDAS